MAGNIKISRAVAYAALAHLTQKRKGTDHPYIYHPLKTMEYLVQMNVGEDLIVAGVLHDVLEDTAVTYEELIAEFGERVAQLVKSHSEDKSKSWKERKMHTIDLCANAPLDVRLLIMADTMANLYDTCRDVQEFGDELWKRFKTTKYKQSWYYYSKVLALEDGIAEKYPAQYKELCIMYYKVFGMPNQKPYKEKLL